MNLILCIFLGISGVMLIFAGLVGIDFSGPEDSKVLDIFLILIGLVMLLAGVYGG